jgi:DivIVA domain-containing protein
LTTQIGNTHVPDARWTTPLTPERVRTVEFARAPFGRRGYNEEEVHRFLSRLAEDISSSDAEKARLRAEIERLRNYYRNAGIDVDDRSARPAPSPQAIAAMTRAQQSADAQIARAEEYARQLTSEARKRYEEVVQYAQRQAAQAAEQAAHAYRERGHGTNDEQEQLTRRIAWLRTFADVTQIQLRSTLEALAREVDRLGNLSVEDSAGPPPSSAGMSPSSVGAPLPAREPA